MLTEELLDEGFKRHAESLDLENVERWARVHHDNIVQRLVLSLLYLIEKEHRESMVLASALEAEIAKNKNASDTGKEVHDAAALVEKPQKPRARKRRGVPDANA